jgi:hypothetical protein
MNDCGYDLCLRHAELFNLLLVMYSAPGNLGPWTGLLIGAVYFIFCWFLGGLYLADLLHLGIAHRSLDYQEWFIKLVTVVNNTFAIYVDPIAWAFWDKRLNRLR